VKTDGYKTSGNHQVCHRGIVSVPSIHSGGIPTRSKPQVNELENEMTKQTNSQDIERSVMVLGAAYAAALLGMIAWIA